MKGVNCRVNQPSTQLSIRHSPDPHLLLLLLVMAGCGPLHVTELGRIYWLGPQCKWNIIILIKFDNPPGQQKQ